MTDAGKPPQRNRLVYGVLVSAVLLMCAFPPLDLGFFSWFALALLFLVLPIASRPRKAVGLAYLFGLIHWGATIIWIGTTVSNWVHSPIGWIAWVLLTAIKSWWFALFGFLCWWIAKKASAHARPLGIACAWTLVEWCRGQTGIAMPWSLVGYTQYRYLPLIQCADIGGVYLVTFAIAFINAALAEMFRLRILQANCWKLRVIAPPVLVVVVILVYGLLTANREYNGTPARLAILQPNLRSDRFAPDSAENDLRNFSMLEASIRPGTAELLIWPETVAPRDAEDDGETRRFFSAMARRHGAYVLVGTSHVDERQRLHNSAALFAPNGALTGRYDKRWLVPMGEWVPLRNVLPFGEVFHFPEETYPGTSESPLTAGPVKMSVLICYESIFPVLSRIGVQHGANLLVNITNDSWAGESSELAQHLAMTTLRAVETRRFVASAATTGVTCIVEPNGHITSLPPYKEGELTKSALLREGRTIYVIIGDAFVGLCVLVVGWILFGRNRVSRAASLS